MASDVLGKGSETDGLDATAIDKLLTDLDGRIAEIRSEVHKEVVQKKYAGKLPKWISDAGKIVKLVQAEKNKLDNETERRRKMLAKLTDSWNLDKVNEVQNELTEANARMKRLRTLVDVHEALEALDFADRHHQRDYTKRATLITKLDDILRILTTNSASMEKYAIQIRDGIARALRDELIVRKETLTFDLFEKWGETFHWDTEKDGINRLLLTVGPQFKDVVIALEMMDLLDKKANHLGKCLLNYLLIPLLDVGYSASFDSHITVSDGKDSLEITVPKFVNDGKNQKNTPADRFEHCFKICDFLNRKLGVSLKSGSTLVQRLIGYHVLKPLKEFIVESILKPAIPADVKDMPKFDGLLTSCDAFMRKLNTSGMIKDEVPSFAQFAANVDVLFLTKRCQCILDQAKRFVATELHNTVEVGGGQKETELAASLDQCLKQMKTGKSGTEEREKTPLRLDMEKPLPPLGEFPRCRVSESMVSLLELLIKTLEESASSSKPLAAARFYHCARNMVELYLDLIPVLHEQQLKMVPQITAVFYNNCYFMCHHLLTLGLSYEAKLLKAMDVHPSVITITFIDFIPRLKEMAGEYMDAQVLMQNRYLIDCLKPAAGFNNVSNRDRTDACRKALKACALQFQHIHRVWRQVLTAPVLLKYQGILADELLKYVVKSVVRLEDIAADDATLLFEIFTSFLKEIESSFIIDKNPYAHRFSESGYYKLKELIFVLNSSLADIEDRWSSGNGPLADWMEALDVKQLIRALFQNTDKRAAVIAKIK